MASVEQACEADEPRNIMAACENQENKDPGDSGEVSLRKMFVEGTTSIATHRCVAVSEDRIITWEQTSP